VEVATRHRAAGAVVAFGDSTTDGLRSGVDRNRRYPDYLGRRLLRHSGPRLSVLNAGITANELLDDSPLALGGPSGLSRLKPDVIDQQAVQDVIALEGINDLRANPSGSAQPVIEGLRKLTARLHRHGIRVFLGTLPPAGGSLGTSDGVNPLRKRVNRWIRSRAHARVVDFDRVLRSPGRPYRLRARYDSGDHLHPNARGYRAMANAVPLSRLRAAPLHRRSLCGG
jgi:lysophospholipase L1-like esterase